MVNALLRIFKWTAKRGLHNNYLLTGFLMALLSLSDLSVAFDDVPLLNRISLNVERGERVCLVGRNGTGKSTLMKTIIGSFSPDSGEIARERAFRHDRLLKEEP